MIFVTGASGFIGKYVVEKLLEEKQEVVVLVRSVSSYRPIGSERIIQGTLENCGSFLEELQEHQHNIDTWYHWRRLFYVYGEGQGEASPIPFIKKEFLCREERLTK